MNKFILKYMIIFVTFISLLFFSLIYFNEYAQKQMMPEMPPMGAPVGAQMPDKPEGPPSSIPLAFIVLVSTIFTYFVTRYIDKNFVKPLINIENNVKSIQKGDLSVAFGEYSENKEVNETFKALNEMVAGLNEKEKLQDEFIRNLVHDLRAPITAQERAMEILNEELKDNELVQGLVENNDAYLKLINNIIDAFSQKEIKIEKIQLNFSKLVDNVIGALETVIKEKNITIKKEIVPDYEVWSDYTSLHRIILNLVYNALEHIDSGKTIEIKVLQNKESDTITIKDNGKGMSDAQIKTVFTKHIVRGNKANKLVSGIGLSVVQDLVIKNNGKIDVESVENSYTKFTIVLPRKV